MAAFLDICRFNPSAGGTVDWTYASPVTGYQSLAAAGAANGRLYKYRAESADLSQWEVGEGAYNSGTGTLARTTILSNSSGTTSRINFSAAPQVAIVALKADLIAIEEDNAFTDAQKAQARRNVASSPIDAMRANGLQINGAFNVSQENGTASVAFGAGSALKYVIDGWKIGKNGTMVLTGQQVSDAPPGLPNSLKVAVGTAQSSIGSGDYVLIQQDIEGFRSSNLYFGNTGSQSISLAFWVKANRTGTYSGSIRNNNSSRSYPFSYVVNSASTWEFKTVTIPGDTAGTWIGDTNGVGLQVGFAMAAGTTFQGAANTWAGANYLGAIGTINGVAATSDTFQITGVIILPGSELPPAARSALVTRPFAQELELCKRYYRKSYDYATAPGTATSIAMNYWQAPNTSGPWVEHIPFVPEMRAAPTVVMYDTAGTSGTIYKGTAGVAAAQFFVSPKGFSGGTSVTTASTEMAFHFTADARL